MPPTFDTQVAETSLDTVGTEKPGTHLDRDEMFHLLQNARRRFALVYLSGRDGPVRMRNLAEQVAAWEHDTTTEALGSEERQRVYVSLYQSHLPKLDDLGVIRYQQRRGLVERLSMADELEPFLEPDPGNGGSDELENQLVPASLGQHWVTYAAATVTGSLLVTALAWAGVFGALGAGATLAAALNAVLLSVFAIGLVWTHR